MKRDVWSRLEAEIALDAMNSSLRHSPKRRLGKRLLDGLVAITMLVIPGCATNQPDPRSELARIQFVEMSQVSSDGVRCSAECQKWLEQ